MISFSDPLNWYYDQLAGLDPETDPGNPKCGFYLLRRRIVRHNDDPNRRPGDPRHKVKVTYRPAAIWEHDDGLVLVIHHENGMQEYHGDLDTIDEFFSRMCRNAITREEYEERINDLYGTDRNGTEG